MKLNNQELMPETTAAIVLMCVAVDEILESQSLNSDIIEELQYIRPLLNNLF